MQKRTTILQRKIIIEEFNKSGLSKRQFCRVQKINEQTFLSWFRLEKQNKNEFNFIPLDIEVTSSKKQILKNENKTSEKITLKINSSYSLEFPTTTSPSWFSSLLKELA